VQGDPINNIDLYGYSACGSYGKCKTPEPLLEWVYSASKKPPQEKKLFKVSSPKVPESWPIPDKIRDGVNKFFPGGVEAEAYVGSTTETTTEYVVSGSDTTGSLAKKQCISWNPYVRGRVEGYIPLGSLWFIQAKAGLGLEIGMRGSIKACFVMAGGVDISQGLDFNLSIGAELAGTVSIYGTVNPFVKLEGSLPLVGSAEAEAGLNLGLEYQFVECKVTGCDWGGSQLKFSVEAYLEANWDIRGIGSGYRQYKTSLAAYPINIPSVADLFR
jgi:hypothetical protein